MFCVCVRGCAKIDEVRIVNENIDDDDEAMTMMTPGVPYNVYNAGEPDGNDVIPTNRLICIIA